jgi:hypothetical protein
MFDVMNEPHDLGNLPADINNWIYTVQQAVNAIVG